MIEPGRMLAILLILTLWQGTVPKKSSARVTTDSFFQMLDAKDVRKAYRTVVCDLWKQQTNEEAWVSLITPWMLQRQAAPKERVFIQEQPMTLPPQVTTGVAIGIRAKATYAAFALYEDVMVYSSSTVAPCVGGFWVSPAPFQP
jgi:hypothetical protein